VYIDTAVAISTGDVVNLVINPTHTIEYDYLIRQYPVYYIQLYSSSIVPTLVPLVSEPEV
jgi:hypothetical protein